MNFRFFLTLATCLFWFGCGGADPNIASGEDLVAPETDGALSARKKSSASDDEVDETAVQAKQFCEREVQQSIQKPVLSLDKKQISACLLALRPDIKKECVKGLKREIVLKIIIGKEGNVIGAFPVGDNADSVEAGCVAEKVKPVKFPSFTGREQLVIEKYPFQLEP